MRDEMVSMGLPRPGKALLWVMGTLVSIWVMFAVAINYGGLDKEAFYVFAGNTQAILHGEVWRLFTAGLMHLPSGSAGVSHIVTVLVGLYFLAPTMEARWGSKRTLFFLFACLITGFLAQMCFEALMPRSIVASLGQPYWFGATGAIEGIAVAWALSHRGQVVRLFFVLPVTSTGLLVFVIGFSIFLVLANDQRPEGLITPFGGMLGGYLFGAGTPSPARRLLLKVRYFFIARRASKARGNQPKLRVIDGGDSPPLGRRPPTDKRFLN
ncbi:MAG TPA: rhomboid family intramembrane serine protease [Polyangiaceae bacterium]|nr:rhomboid family intramembrane serine protease [Polyangiaceae bacterium]